MPWWPRRFLQFGWSGRHPVYRFAIPEDTLDTQNPQNTNPQQLGGCFVRLLWLAVGNLVLVLSAVGIVQNRAGFQLGAMDVVLAVTAIFLPAMRYVDIRFLNGKTSDNRQATMADWLRYSVTVLGVSLALWVGAHLIS